MSEQNPVLFGKNYFEVKNINKADYTNTLAAEALRTGFYSSNDLDKVKSGVMEALAEVVKLYTKNESSSVRTDTARDLAASLLYNIDTYLLSLKNDETAARTLLERNPIELYGKGYLINEKIYKEALVYFGKVRYTRLKTNDEAYNKTLDKYYKNYLSSYSAKFSAHNKIYLTLLHFGINGAFHIDEALEVLKKLLEINKGKQSDFIIDHTET